MEDGGWGREFDPWEQTLTAGLCYNVQIRKSQPMKYHDKQVLKHTDKMFNEGHKNSVINMKETLSCTSIVHDEKHSAMMG